MNSELKKTVIIGAGTSRKRWPAPSPRANWNSCRFSPGQRRAARVVAELAATGWETRPEMLRKDADIYLIAVSDRAVAEVAATLPIPEEAAVAHTAGSVPGHGHPRTIRPACRFLSDADLHQRARSGLFP